MGEAEVSSPRNRATVVKIIRDLLVIGLAVYGAAAGSLSVADDVPLISVDATGIAQAQSQPALAALGRWAGQTRLLDSFFARPDIVAAADGVKALAVRLQVTPQELLFKLTGGGISLVVHTGEPPKPVLKLTAVDADIAARFLQAVDGLVADLGVSASVEHGELAGWKTRTVPGLMAAYDGPNILLATDRQLLQSAIERTGSDAPKDNSFFHVAIKASLAEARKGADLQKTLAWPAQDAGGVVFLGGWFDLLRQFDQLTLDLTQTGNGLEIIAATANPHGAPVSPGLEGYWGEKGQTPLPLLKPKGTLISSSWVRDYRSLWAARDKLLEPEMAGKITSGDSDAGKQMQVVGATFTPAELVSELGPHFRIVVLASEPPYAEVTLPNVLPAGVAVVELRDETKVRNWAGPVLRILGLIINGDQGIFSTTEQVDGVDFVTLSQPTSPEKLRRGSLDRFNLRTTYAFAHGSFVIGSTPAAVKAVVAEMKKDADRAGESPRTATENQTVDIAAVSGLIDGMDEALSRGFVLTGGLTPDEARDEIAELKRLFAQLGRLDVREGFTSSGFEYHINWSNSSVERAR
jgi:hypothetical protein